MNRNFNNFDLWLPGSVNNTTIQTHLVKVLKGKDSLNRDNLYLNIRPLEYRLKNYIHLSFVHQFRGVLRTDKKWKFKSYVRSK